MAPPTSKKSIPSGKAAVPAKASTKSVGPVQSPSQRVLSSVASAQPTSAPGLKTGSSRIAGPVAPPSMPKPAVGQAPSSAPIRSSVPSTQPAAQGRNPFDKLVQAGTGTRSAELAGKDAKTQANIIAQNVSAGKSIYSPGVDTAALSSQLETQIKADKILTDKKRAERESPWYQKAARETGKFVKEHASEMVGFAGGMAGFAVGGPAGAMLGAQAGRAAGAYASGDKEAAKAYAEQAGSVALQAAGQAAVMYGAQEGYIPASYVPAASQLAAGNFQGAAQQAAGQAVEQGWQYASPYIQEQAALAQQQFGSQLDAVNSLAGQATKFGGQPISNFANAEVSMSGNPGAGILGELGTMNQMLPITPASGMGQVSSFNWGGGTLGSGQVKVDVNNAGWTGGFAPPAEPNGETNGSPTQGYDVDEPWQRYMSGSAFSEGEE